VVSDEKRGEVRKSVGVLSGEKEGVGVMRVIDIKKKNIRK
jgi:hypothetical protein